MTDFTAGWIDAMTRVGHREDLSLQELIEVIRSVAAQLHAGVSTHEAWRQAWGAHSELSQGDEALVPQELADLSSPRAFPGLRQMCADVPDIVRYIKIREKHRSDKDLKSRTEQGICIRDVIAQEYPHAPLSLRWWKDRSAQAHQRQRAVRSLLRAADFTYIIGAAPDVVLDSLAQSIEDDVSLDQHRELSRAGPKSSATVLSLLPVLGIGMAHLLGADPVGFFVHTWLGVCSALLGVALMLGGMLSMRRMVIAPFQCQVHSNDVALAMVLVSAALRSGVSIPDVLLALGRAFDNEALSEVSTKLLDGEEWWSAWGSVSHDFLPLARVLEEPWAGGALAVDSLLSAARSLRAVWKHEAAQESVRLGVRLLIPLGLLLLPAFIVLGIIPILVQLAVSTA